MKAWSIRRIALTVIGLVVGVPILAVVLLILWIVLFFNAGILYSGDGSYTKSDGSRAATFRVDFPEIDLTTRGVQNFAFRRLGPAITFHAGLRITGSSQSDAVVRLSLSNEKGQLVFDRLESLENFEWHHDFAQLRGKVTEYQDEHGNTRFRKAEPTGADDGFGTSFTPRWWGRYVFRVEVVRPDTRGVPLRATPVFEAYTAGP